MRNSFIAKLTEMVLKDDRIHVILPDIGVFAFKQAGFPEKQTINVGICEALAADLAAGLVISGKIPFIYSIAPFVTERCYEQIKMACYNNLSIKIVGVGAGLSYYHEGPSHHAINDIAIMRVLPNMSVYSPCSSDETALITVQMVNNCKPSYIRLTTKPSDEYDWDVEEYQPLMCASYSANSKIAVFTTGGIISNVLQAINNDPEFSVYSISQISPFVLSDTGVDFLSILKTHRKIIVVEEHSIHCGLASVISDFMTSYGINSILYRFGINASYSPICDSYSAILKHNSLDVESLAFKFKRIRDRVNV